MDKKYTYSISINPYDIPKWSISVPYSYGAVTRFARDDAVESRDLEFKVELSNLRDAREVLKKFI